MAEKKEQGNVVMTFHIGSTRAKICDDYCHNRTQQEIDEILERIAGRVYEQLYNESAVRTDSKA